MLSNSLSSWSQNSPSTGKVALSDTSIVIPIDYLRIANKKMIERNYYYKISVEQDSIIKLKDKQIVNIKNSSIRKKDAPKYAIGGFVLGLVIGLFIK